MLICIHSRNNAHTPTHTFTQLRNNELLECMLVRLSNVHITCSSAYTQIYILSHTHTHTHTQTHTHTHTHTHLRDALLGRICCRGNTCCSSNVFPSSPCDVSLLDASSLKIWACMPPMRESSLPTRWLRMSMADSRALTCTCVCTCVCVYVRLHVQVRVHL